MHYPQSMGTPPIQQNQGGLPLPQMNNTMGNQARIKTEPGLDSPGMNPNGQPQQPYQNGPPPSVNAADRAAAHLHMNYGPRASASINAIQSSRQQVPNGQQQQQQQPPMTQQQYQMMQQQRAANGMQQAQARGQPQVQGQGQPSMTPEQYKQMIARQTAGQMQHIAANGHNAQNSVGGAQTDGAGDEVEGLSVIKQFGPNGEELSMGRIEIDNLLRSKIEAMGQRMEGGGLMLPLKQASTSKSRKIKAKSSHPVDTMIQVDGGDDDDDTDVKDEDVDEDAINSDLDDPDDNVNDEEDDDEGMGHIMLCMYDKVQRVKNKWLVISSGVQNS
jgi:transcription initiation factor TFIIA large subunit